jgi:D-aminopeptidase
MTNTRASELEHALHALPLAYPGPGGAVAVLRDGEVLARHAWGWANAEQRIAFTPQTLFRICSISKQFTCSLVLDAFADPSVLDGDVRGRLPGLRETAPGALQLCHNQSGLRDYWAVAMLCGSPVEARFGEAEAQDIIARTRSLHFAPGTRYSYVNQNFRMLSDILQERSGRSYGELLRERIFDRVGMEHALLAADTSSMLDGATGYEGNNESGFRAAENRIIWTGDAGIGASLDDMIAWERWIDADRDDPGALYNRLSVPVSFADGQPASYGFGLGRSSILGRAATGHGGALRGWRSFRCYIPAERVSVVVLFNHMADPYSAALDVLAAVLGEARPKPTPAGAPEWTGNYLEPESGLAVRIVATPDGRVRLHYGHAPELLDLRPDGSVGGDNVSLRQENGEVWMHRPRENQHARLAPCTGVARDDVAGRFRSDELDAELTCVNSGGALYGAFSGRLGQGRMELLQPVGGDVWLLPCPRALDHTPPGDWTLAFSRNDQGRVAGVEVGCWLARRISYAAAGV